MSWKALCPCQCKSTLYISKTGTTKKCFHLIKKIVKEPLHFCVFPISPPALSVSDKTNAPEDTLAQQQARMSASSATRELDELMASLSDFKVQSNVSTLYRGGKVLLQLFEVFTLFHSCYMEFAQPSKSVSCFYKLT